MTSRKRNLLISAIAIPAVICGVWFWLGKGKHHHKTEKLTGETSFDVFAADGRIHMLMLREHAGHQKIVYRRWPDHGAVNEVTLPAEAKEKIISRRSNDVQIAAAGDHVLAAWQISGTGYANRGPMRMAESRDGGQTWQRAVAPTAENRTDDQGFFDIETDSRGHFHVVWLDSQAKVKGLRYASFSDGKWTAAQTIDAETCQCCWNSLRKNPQGELMVLYRNARPRDMALAKFDGKTWVKAGLVDNFGWKIEICPHAGGSLAADNTSTYAVTWTGLESAVGTYLSRKEGKSSAWQKPLKFGTASARNPDIALNASDLVVVWDEFDGPNRRAKFIRIPKDSAAALPAAQTLSEAGAASYPRVVSGGAGFYTFWTESQNGTATVRGRKL